MTAAQSRVDDFDVLRERIRLRGRLTTLTALHIGGGGAEMEAVDLPVQKTTLGVPVIPGSSIKGVVRSGVEALLRNILTPSAAMEGGYRKYRVETKDDELVEGLLVSEDAASIVLRQPNVPDQRIPRASVKRAAFLNLSIMPEGLLEAMKPEQVSDLFALLMSLK